MSTTDQVLPRMAYGVDPRRKEYYSLRQSRYNALGDEIARLARQKKDKGERLRVLDVGVGSGVLRRHVESHAGADNIDYHGADIFLSCTPSFVYKHEDWTLYRSNLMEGMPFLQSNRFDVVVCEQVMEHLEDLATPLAELERVCKPGGLLILGVPTFPDGIHWLRLYGVPLFDRIVGTKKVRGHCQAFSKRSFVKLVRRYTGAKVHAARGFRIVSGGILRPLENYHWWWKLNRIVGALVPSLCVEVQLLAIKQQASAEIEVNDVIEQKYIVTAETLPARKAA